ncbi:replication-relaxation family protein [Cryptosporangium arvum]|uniref:Protein involved in plasmid replication-relaxation n=1 Tax=Cryptosporangium arvum DSM 44712 TaxID=927661 RepID=A0A011AJ07_9ACTN|nr:replication-relaxation family protein [Cryptosporangium arvum]EXG82006.1 hypothetical protein CryarDRAFT_3137 [Cryptosporangium arvum DSM 44712]
MVTRRPPRHSPGGELPAGSQTTLLEIDRRLTPRDHTIALLLEDHTTLTTDQLTSVLFDAASTARHRLHLLRRIGFIDRFTRNYPGSNQPICWLPGLLSSRYVALTRDENPPTLKTLRERQDRVYSSRILDHTLATNAFFTALLADGRRRSEGGLLRWWSERQTAARFGRRINPDGHGVWSDGTQQTGFFLELDRGTEPLGRLVDKLASHRRLRAEAGPRYPLLFVLPSRAREQNLHRRLADRPEPTLVIASTCAESGYHVVGPFGPIWRLAGNGRHRVPLAELPSNHGQPGPLTPGPPLPDEHPLHLLKG